MNHKQKLGYTLLGAGIMAVGITIGQFITPQLEAQNNGVFDKVVCREIEVVDKNGNKAIALFSDADTDRFLQVCDKQGKVAVVLSSTNVGNGIVITDLQEKSAIILISNEQHNSMFLYDSQREDKMAIRLQSTEGINAVNLYDEREDTAVTLHSGKGADAEELGNGVFVIHKTGEVTTLGD